MTVHRVAGLARADPLGLVMQLALAALVGVLIGMLLTGFVPSSVLAHHSVPNPKHYWDCDLDGVPDDTCVRITMAGNGWDLARTNRFTSAVNQWSNNTRFDPYLGPGNLREAFVDRAPACGPFNGAYAGVCRLTEFKQTYYRMADADVYFNTAGHQWNTALAADLTKADFQGVAVHELGHFVRLIDLSAANCGPAGDRYTMCGAVTKAETFQLRDLEQDDKTSANNVY